MTLKPPVNTNEAYLNAYFGRKQSVDMLVYTIKNLWDGSPIRDHDKFVTFELRGKALRYSFEKKIST